MMVFLASRSNYTPGDTDDSTNSWASVNFLPVYLTVVSFIPFWFRFWQCINKQYYTGFQHENKTQLWNAGKYFSKLIPPFIVLMMTHPNKQLKDGSLPSGFGLWIVFELIATLYCSFWDYYFDWGLFRSKKKGKYGLRD